MTFLGTAVLFQFRIIDHKNKLGVLICLEHFAVEGPSIHHCFAKPFDEFKCIRYFGEKNAKYKLSICKLSQTFLGFWYQWYLVYRGPKFFVLKHRATDVADAGTDVFNREKIKGLGRYFDRS